MFSKTAQWYDKIYLSMKDYGAEVEKLTANISEHCRSTGNRSLDVACGTLFPPLPNGHLARSR